MFPIAQHTNSESSHRRNSPYFDCIPRLPERRNPLISQISAPCCRSRSGCSGHTRFRYIVQPSSQIKTFLPLPHWGRLPKKNFSSFISLPFVLFCYIQLFLFYSLPSTIHFTIVCVVFAAAPLLLPRLRSC